MPTLIQSQIVIPSGLLEIRPEGRRAVTLEDAPEVFPETRDPHGHSSDPVETAYHVFEVLRSQCGLQRSHEHLFLLLYFDRIVEKLSSGATLRAALLPLPKARFSMCGDEHRPVSVDFAFWTGRRFVTVFICESRFNEDSAEERFLRVWGCEVFRLMADQLETRGLVGESGSKILDALWLRH